MAWHPIDGDLTSHIDACQPGFRFSAHGLAACALDTSALGNHTIPFFLSDASLAASSMVATRTVVVHPVCAAAEHLSSDGSGMVCSSSGFCPVGSQPTEQMENTKPTLHYTSAALGNLYVPRGTQYRFCDEGATFANSMCASGPLAFDEEDGFISHRVLACAPNSCLAYGCPGHELHIKGLALGCGVDTERAPIGTTFTISFTVFDSHRPAASAAINQTITVISPCSLSEIYCPDRAVQCAAVPCSLRAAMDEPEEEYIPPEVTVSMENLPANLASFSQESSAISVWGICEQPPPIDFADICGASFPAGVSLPQHNSQQCVHGADACVSRVVEHTSTTAEPLVTLIKRHELACTSLDASSCIEPVCSLAAIAQGRCASSRQSFTLHAFHASRAASEQLDVDNSIQSLQVLTTITPSLSQAVVAVVINIAAPASEALSSSAQQLAMQDLAAQSLGPPRCSAVAAVLHSAVVRQIESSPVCHNLDESSRAAADADHFASGRLVVLLEVLGAGERDSPPPPSEGSDRDGNNWTPMGSLDLNVSITVGADIGSGSSVEADIPSLRSMAASCLADWEAFLPLSHGGINSHSSDTPTVPVVTGSGEALGLLVTQMSVGAVMASDAPCPLVPPEERAVDEAAFHIEQAVMQQHMMDLPVCTSCRFSLQPIKTLCIGTGCDMQFIIEHTY